MNSSNKILDFIKNNKWHIIIWSIGIIMFGVWIYNQLTSKNILLNGVFLNVENSTDALENDFMAKEEMNPQVSVVTFDDEFTYKLGDNVDSADNFEAVQAIITQTEEELLDFVVGTEAEMLDIAYNSRFSELTTFLKEGKAADYKQYFLYVDLAVIDKLEEAYKNEEDTSAIALPDCRKPDKMEQPVPVMLDLSQCEAFADIYGSSKGVVMGLISDAPHQDMVYDFLEYIYPRDEQ